MDRLIRFDNTIKDLMKKRVSNRIYYVYYIFMYINTFTIYI